MTPHRVIINQGRVYLQNIHKTYEKHTNTRKPSNCTVYIHFVYILISYLLSIFLFVGISLCHGMTTSFPAVTTPKLSANCSSRLTFTLTTDQESWIMAIGHWQTSNTNHIITFIFEFQIMAIMTFSLLKTVNLHLILTMILIPD